MASTPRDISGVSQPMGHRSPTNLVSRISVHRCGYPERLLQKVEHGIQLLKHTEVKVMISWGDMLSVNTLKKSQGYLTHEGHIRSKLIHDWHLGTRGLAHRLYLEIREHRRTIWLPLVTELSTLGANTSPENSERPSRFPSSRSGHWARMSSRRPAN